MFLDHIKYNKFYYISLVICFILGGQYHKFHIEFSWLIAFLIGGSLALIGSLLDKKYSRKDLDEG